ncbi:MAG: fibronectin type III domain-containing protein [Kofleriaceae bacterium]
MAPAAGNNHAMFGGRVVLALGLLIPAFAHAEAPERCIDVQFTPSDKLQIVAWLETPAGDYLDTIFITQQTGTFGLGNRPGRFDFNSGPIWPYGRRITTFPVWSHANGQAFAQVVFQNDTSDDPDACFAAGSGADYQQCGENNLSHPFNQSSSETHFCRPLMPTELSWDTGTCATTAYSDKGKFSASGITTGYPPRTDIIRGTGDSPSVDMYKALNPFDAVSQPTPQGGASSHAPWPVPADLSAGDYVLKVEVAQESDFNATYNATTYPAPTGIFWSEYGKPYRGQPSIVYRVPFTIGAATSEASVATYFGYGDPDGLDGAIRPPDATITTATPGTGASRLELVADGTDMYRVKVAVSPNVATEVPAIPSNLVAMDVNSSGLAMSFIAPGVGQDQLRVAGYEIRVRASTEMTAANFADSMPVTAKVTPEDPGHLQTFDLDGLLPDTDYWIGIRAFDGCHNGGDVAIARVTTAARLSGAVDACFVATAAYGSVMANDVELLRHFRDSLLRTNALGELGVETYYTFGPAIAGIVGESDTLRETARAALRPLVERVRGLAF